MSLLPCTLVEIIGSSQSINRLMVSNETVKVKISEVSAPISITHADDFIIFKYFHDVDLSVSAQSG